MVLLVTIAALVAMRSWLERQLPATAASEPAPAAASPVPEWLPLFPAARVEVGETLAESGMWSGTLTLYGDFEPAELLEYCATALVAAGLEIEVRRRSAAPRAAGYLVASDGAARRFRLTVAPGQAVIVFESVAPDAQAAPGSRNR